MSALTSLAAPIKITLVLIATSWTSVLLYRIYRHYVQHPDEGGPSFFGALRAFALLSLAIAITI